MVISIWVLLDSDPHTKAEDINSLYSGTVEELNYANDLDKSYPIVTDCQFIDIDIKLLDLEEEYDYLHIGENHYTGSLSPFQVIYYSCLNLQKQLLKFIIPFSDSDDVLFGDVCLRSKEKETFFKINGPSRV